MATGTFEGLKISEKDRLPAVVLGLDDRLKQAAAAGLVNETFIEAWLAQLDRKISRNEPCFWLLTARVTELAIVCAGRYADACEFAAAGDLIVNPRLIKVHFFGEQPRVAVKRRHGALSAQFNPAGTSRAAFKQWFKSAATIEIAKAPLLTFFTDRLQQSGMIHTDYLNAVRRRTLQVAETLAFLASWQLEEAAELYRRRAAATAETRRFIDSHLCRFDLDIFNAIGKDIQNLARGKPCSGDFLALPPALSWQGPSHSRPVDTMHAQFGAGFTQ